MHSGPILRSTCRLGGAVGGLGHTEDVFCWLSMQACRSSAQQGSSNGTSSVLDSTVEIAFFTSFQVVCSELAEVAWLAKGRISHRDVAPDFKVRPDRDLDEYQRGLSEA